MTKLSEEINKNARRSGGEPVVESSADMLTACAKISSERYQAFVESISEGVYEVDIHGNFLYFNNSLSRIFGYPPEEIQFQNFSRFLDEDQAKVAHDTFGRMYQTEEGVSDLVWRFLNKNGETRFVELSANLIRNREGQKIGFRGIARDITDRFRAQEALRNSERRFRTLLDFVPYPMVVYTLDARVSYLNPAFAETFGWKLDELAGKSVPNVPPGLEGEIEEVIRRLLSERGILRNETKKLTKDGRILDVVFRASVYYEKEDEPAGALVIHRDISHEKRIKRNNEALLRLSMALPEYYDLEDLLEYVSDEMKQLLGVEGALVILLDEEKKELVFKAASHEDSDTEQRIRKKEIRFPAHKGIAGEVIRTGKPVIVHDTLKNSNFYSVVDTMAGFKTRSMLDVPLRSKDRIIGVLCVMNKKLGAFDQTDVELLSMISGTVALSVENARFAEQLKEALNEVTSLNRAKDKVINHLSHELKTPLAVLGASLNLLEKKMSSLPQEKWIPTFERARRSLNRILEMQYEVEDIMRARHDRTYSLMNLLLEQCADQMEALLAEEVGEGSIVRRIRERIDLLYGMKEAPPQDLSLENFVRERLDEIKPNILHRKVTIKTEFEPSLPICMPKDPLKKVVDGLIKNALENTPDEGEVEVSVRKRGEGSELRVRDCGVGITAENQRRIFEGFYTTQETMDYASKRPFDFNAGGKGADLLRMKIFSERYGFQIEMQSSRCPFISKKEDGCPGRISLCSDCKGREDCLQSGGTTFTVFFPAATEACPKSAAA
jgi:PAS domain S-box-containing protein